MEALFGIGVVVILAFFGLLSRLESGRRRRMIADVTRSSTMRRFDLSGDLLPPEQTSLGPVDYRRVPDPVGYVQTTQTARHAPTVETLFILPALTAMGTAVALTIAAGGLALLFGWPARTLLIVFAVSVGGAWFWRLGWSQKAVWSVESWTGKDLDGDRSIGRPALGFAVVNPGRARGVVAREAAQNATEARTESLQRFVDVCYLSGCSETSHGITASGPDRDNYVTCRDTLMALGLAAWKHPDRPKGGWQMTTDPVTCKGIVGNHVA